MKRKNILYLLSLFPVMAFPKSGKPNVLIIYTDEHSFRTLGCYRSILPKEQAEVWGDGVVVETPNIDYLADNGVLCSNFYTTTPVSSPSRSSLMTGMYPQQTGVVTNDLPMKDEMVTFAQDFMNAGYRTGYIGKWHLDGPAKPGWKPERKFGFEDNRYMMNRGHYKRIVEIKDSFDITYSGAGINKNNFMSDFLTSKAVDYIREHKAENFCCLVSYPDPHGPNIVRSPYDKMYTHLRFNLPATARKDKRNLPSWSFANNKMENMSQYFGMVKCIDDQVGILVNELKSQGIFDNTIIVFTSDHGDLCGEHGRTNKSVPLEASAKVPMIICYPHKLVKGKVIDNVISVIDFAPTILSLAGVKSDFKRSGEDFSPLIYGQKSRESWKNIAFMRGTDSRQGPAKNWVSVVYGNLKLTLSDIPQDEPWLTDLKKDPDELVNEYNNKDYQSDVSFLLNELKKYGEREKDIRINSEKIQKEFLRIK